VFSGGKEVPRPERVELPTFWFVVTTPHARCGHDPLSRFILAKSAERPPQKSPQWTRERETAGRVKSLRISGEPGRT
jgi:hypothetical protein